MQIRTIMYIYIYLFIILHNYKFILNDLLLLLTIHVKYYFWKQLFQCLCYEMLSNLFVGS